MPELRLQKARATLPPDYQFGDAREPMTVAQRIRAASHRFQVITLPPPPPAGFCLRQWLEPESTPQSVYVYDGSVNDFVAVPRG